MFQRDILWKESAILDERRTFFQLHGAFEYDNLGMSQYQLWNYRRTRFVARRHFVFQHRVKRVKLNNCIFPTNWPLRTTKGRCYLEVELSRTTITVTRICFGSVQKTNISCSSIAVLSITNCRSWMFYIDGAWRASLLAQVLIFADGRHPYRFCFWTIPTRHSCLLYCCLKRYSEDMI